MLDALRLVLIAAVVGYSTLTLTMLAGAAVELYRQRRTARLGLAAILRSSGDLPPVSILVPAYNEEATIARTVDSLLSLDYQRYEILVINDGSLDRTLDVLRERFELVAARNEARRELATQRVKGVYASRRDVRLRVVDKRNGGKADALNAGIDQARHALVLAVDADVVLAEDALVHLALPFVTNPETVATSGIIRPQNGCEISNGRLVRVGLPRNWLERIQVIEYLRAYGVGRMFFNRMNAHLIISGAFGLFSRQLLLDLGGYQTHSVGEDMELVVRANRLLRQRGQPYRMWFSADALCLTEAPHVLGELGRQRTRWHQGLLSTLRLHKSMFARPAFGSVGMVAFPFFVAELFYPFFEVVGWLVLPVFVALGWMPFTDALEVVLAFVLFSSIVSFVAIGIDAAFFSFFSKTQDRLTLMAASAVEQCGYHQCTIFFRLRAFLRYYRSLQLRTAWQPPTRAAAKTTAPTDRPG